MTNADFTAIQQNSSWSEAEIGGAAATIGAVLVGNNEPRQVTCPTQAKGDEVVSWIVPRKRR